MKKLIHAFKIGFMVGLFLFQYISAQNYQKLAQSGFQMHE